MTRRLAVVIAALLLGLGCSGASPGTDHARHAGHEGHEAAAADDAWRAVDDDDALFTIDCPFSHRASDDPIVQPGQPGASHSHEFFGSTETDASSTGASLQATTTTCEDTEDTAAYWTPTLSVDGVPVDPTLLRAYYRARPGVDVREVAAPPVGLAMLAGDPDRRSAGEEAAPATEQHDGEAHEHHGGAATTSPAVAADPTAEAGWGCGLRPRAFHVEPPTDCTDISPLTLRLRFPDCWDGRRLDAPDHRSHVARSVEGACPDGYPVLMTELQVSIQWPVTGPAAGRATLSSGSTAGAHGDFLNGWDPDALDRHVELCIHAQANCTIG